MPRTTKKKKLKKKVILGLVGDNRIKMCRISKKEVL
jgi:hypothetical protein